MHWKIEEYFASLHDCCLMVELLSFRIRPINGLGIDMAFEYAILIAFLPTHELF
jgi:hypothetical protein